MNSLISGRGEFYIKRSRKLLFVVLALVWSFNSVWAWEIDFSRRRKDFRNREVLKPILEETALPSSYDPRNANDRPIQEIVIVNTEKGFLPSVLRMNRDNNYMIHVVNINKNEKNVSFIMEAFSEHMATYFGQLKSFQLTPKKEGVFSFQCPETASEGRLVVVAAGASSEITDIPPVRLQLPAAEGPPISVEAAEEPQEQGQVMDVRQPASVISSAKKSKSSLSNKLPPKVNHKK